MKKLLLIIVLLYTLSLVACKKEEELEMKNFTYTNQDVVIKSFFNDSELVLNLNI